jgi:hypothetical protein
MDNTPNNAEVESTLTSLTVQDQTKLEMTNTSTEDSMFLDTLQDTAQIRLFKVRIHLSNYICMSQLLISCMQRMIQFH